MFSSKAFTLNLWKCLPVLYREPTALILSVKTLIRIIFDTVTCLPVISESSRTVIVTDIILIIIWRTELAVSAERIFKLVESLELTPKYTGVVIVTDKIVERI